MVKIQLCQTKDNCKFYHSKIEKQTHFPQKVYKLSKAKFSHFDRTREQIFRTYDLPQKGNKMRKKEDIRYYELRCKHL